MGVAEIILAYLQVLLSGPVIAGGVATLFLCKFRGSISALIDRIAGIKLPGGSEVLTPRQLVPDTSSDSDIVPGDTVEEVGLPEGITLSTDQQAEIVQLVQSERANAYLWEYRYLNHYLVRGTQATLDWIAEARGAVSLSLVDSQLQTSIPEARERTAILSALESHRLIVASGNTIQVTAKGREYLGWRGPLPPSIPGDSSSP